MDPLAILILLTIFSLMLVVLQVFLLKKSDGIRKALIIHLAVALFLTSYDYAFYTFDLSAFDDYLLVFYLIALVLLGPTLWYYLLELTNRANEKKKIHMILPLVYGGLNIIPLALVIIYGSVPEYKSLVKTCNYLIVYGNYAVSFVSTTYYIYKSVRLYTDHNKCVREVYSYREAVGLRWLRFLIIAFSGFSVLTLALNFILFDGMIGFSIVQGITIVYVIYLGINSLKQTPDFSELQQKEEVKEKEHHLDNDFFQELKHDLIVAMEQEQIYLDDALNIQILATKLSTNSKYISQLINQAFQKNFISFVNEYRVQHAQKLLLKENTSNFSIEGIGYEVGFKSKSAFYAAFKKSTGITPSAFIRTSKSKVGEK